MKPISKYIEFPSSYLQMEFESDRRMRREKNVKILRGRWGGGRGRTGGVSKSLGNGRPDRRYLSACSVDARLFLAWR